MPPWEQHEVGPVAVAALGQRYRRYRLADGAAEEAMVGSLRRFGQQTPLVACRRPHGLEVIDGFKRLAAAPQVSWTSVSVRVIEADERSGQGGDLRAEPGGAALGGVGGGLAGAGLGA